MSNNAYSDLIERVAETGLAPPATGVIVSAVEFPAGFITLNRAFAVDVVMIVLQTSWLVPVARPTTVFGSPLPFSANCSCPGSATLTWKDTS